MVKKWDLVLEREKEDKHAQLLQRLELQHRLIAKSDLLSKLAEKEAKERHKKVYFMLYFMHNIADICCTNCLGTTIT